jgi:hypothetical protein
VLNENTVTGGQTTCSGALTGPLAPTSVKTSPVALAPITSIKVVADASVSWQLMFFKGVYYPPLNIDTMDWHPLLHELDGTGNWALSLNLALPQISAT